MGKERLSKGKQLVLPEGQRMEVHSQNHEQKKKMGKVIPKLLLSKFQIALECFSSNSAGACWGKEPY